MNKYTWLAALAPFVVMTCGCSNGNNCGGPHSCTGAGGALNLPTNSGTAGTSTSSSSNTGGQSGCNYNGQWYPAGSEWTDGDGCGCTGIYPDAGILVLRHCTENICDSDGFVSIADVGTYCPVEMDASAEVCAAEECIYLVTTDKPDAS